MSKQNRFRQHLSRQHVASAVLVAAFALSGCGAPAVGSLTAVGLPAKAPIQRAAAEAAPTVSLTRGAAPPHAERVESTQIERQHVLAGIRLAGEIDLADEDLIEDAESLGYSVMAGIGQKFNKTGVVRRIDGGYGFVANKSLFKKLFDRKKAADTYTLTGSAEVLADIAKRVDRKALLKGTVDKDNVVTVTSVKGLADLGFLTNWFSKGKIAGTIKDSAGVPLADVKIEARSSEGFVFSGLTEADGTFEVKSLTAGTYTLKLSKDGFKAATDSITVNKRKAVMVDHELTAQTPATAAAQP